MQGRKFADHS